jgi:nicotinate-nucleotide pyrophosphorylase (carboxylating)
MSISPASEHLIDLALAEDLGEWGDITSEFFVDAKSTAAGNIVARQDCIIAGSELAARVFTRVDPAIHVELVLASGDSAGKGDGVLTMAGPARSVLTAERIALNFLQRLCGVATHTRRFVDLVEGTGVTLLDTRKTTPGWRELEKAAVVAGGGQNHRMGLYDMAMVKDNHLLAASGDAALQAAIDRLKEARPDARVEMEVDRLEQAERFLAFRGVDVILLDNMSNDQLREAVALRGDSPVKLEASGGVNLDTVRGIAETGVDFISVGALTHSAVSVDLGLDFDAA